MTGDKEYIVSKVRDLKGRTFKALLGKGDSGETVLVTGKANYVWVRVKYGSSLGAPVQALNRHVPPIHGRMVRVQEIDRAGIKGYEVIDFDDKGTPYYHDTTNAVTLPAHGHTHECSQDTFGTDPVNLYTRCWAELRVEPTDPCSLYTYVTHGWYMCEDLGWFAGGNSPLFVPPDAGLRYDLVYIDCSGTIGIETGDVGGEVALIPEPPDFTIPLAAIQLTGSVGCIVEDMILDCRVMPNLKMPAGGARFDDSISPSTIFPDAAAWTGAQDYPSRTDHRHGIICGTPSSITTANAEGASTEFVRKDHAHQGAHSLSEAGQAQLFGDITLSEGANVTLTQAGQDIQIASAGGGGAAAVHQHDGPAAAQGGDILNPVTVYVTGTCTVATQLITPVGVPSSVGAANAAGAALDHVRRDHVHQGVHSVSKSGDAQIFGDVTLSEGANITLTEVGQNIQITAGGGGGGMAVHQHSSPAAADGGDILNPTTVYVTGTTTCAGDLRISDGAVGDPAIQFINNPDTGIFGGAGLIDFAIGGALAFRISAIQARLHDGGAGLPGMAFFNDGDTGMYRIGANNLGFATTATKALEIDAAQNVITTADLTVGDDLTVTDHAWMATGTCAGDFQIGDDLTVEDTIYTDTIIEDAANAGVTISDPWLLNTASIGIKLSVLDIMRGWRDDFLGLAIHEQYTAVSGGAGSGGALYAGHGGFYSLTAGAGVGFYHYLWLGNAADGYATLDADLGWVMMVRMNLSHTTNMVGDFGARDSAYNNLLHVGLDTTVSGNWIIRTRIAAGAWTAADSGVAADINPHWHTLDVHPITGGLRQVDYSLDGTRIATTTVNVPTAPLTPDVRCYAPAAFARVVNLDFWGVIPRNL